MKNTVREESRGMGSVGGSHQRGLALGSRGRCQRGFGRGDILLLLAVFLALLLAAEFLLRTVVTRSSFLDPKTDAYWEQRLHELSRDPLWASQRKEGDIVHDERLGWRMRPNYESLLATHDAVGHRSTLHPSVPGGGSIVLLGDSFTYGLGVSNDETYASHLVRQTGHEVVNMGVNAYGADQALLLWEREGVSVGADVVVLGYFVDNFYRNALTVRDGPKPFFGRDGAEDGFVLKGVPVPDSEQYVALLGRRARLAIVDAALYGTARVRRRLDIRVVENVREQAELSKYILRTLRDSVEASGARFVVLIIGHCFDGNPDYVLAEASIEKNCEVLDLECLNTARAMRDGNYASYYGENCHWSMNGHMKVAGLLAELLADAGVAPISTGHQADR